MTTSEFDSLRPPEPTGGRRRGRKRNGGGRLRQAGADDAALSECMSSLEDLYAELDTRAATIRKLPKDLCPENKVTPELAAKRSLGLYPIVIAIDECQELFTSPDYAKEAERLCEAIIKRGPALGIIPIFATQRPDAKSGRVSATSRLSSSGGPYLPVSL